jgi:hypothetical protein
MSAHPARTPRALARQWVGRLAPYRQHRNDEHCEALLDEAARFAGFQLESDLAESTYWSEAPLARRVAVLLFLVDREAATRRFHRGRVIYEAAPDAESWAASQTALAPYLGPTLELIAALRNGQTRRLASAE